MRGIKQGCVQKIGLCAKGVELVQGDICAFVQGASDYLYLCAMGTMQCKSGLVQGKTSACVQKDLNLCQCACVQGASDCLHLKIALRAGE